MIDRDVDVAYEPPSLMVLGTVAELTQSPINKTTGNADGGILFENQPTSVIT